MVIIVLFCSSMDMTLNYAHITTQVVKDDIEKAFISSLVASDITISQKPPSENSDFGSENKG